MTAALMDIPTPLAADPRVTQMSATDATQRKTDDFAATLDRAAKTGDDDALRTGLRDLVAETFLTPIFKMMRNDPFKSELFHGGSGEEMFAQQMDQTIAARMSGSMKLPFVDNAYQRFSRAMGHAPKVNTRA